jgi:hypothetical protein
VAAVDGLGRVDQLGEGLAHEGEDLVHRPVVADRSEQRGLRRALLTLSSVHHFQPILSYDLDLDADVQLGPIPVSG